MRIEVNGEFQEINNQSSVQSLLDTMAVDTKGMAVAINNTVIPKMEWTEIELKEADKILLIRATQGG